MSQAKASSYVVQRYKGRSDDLLCESTVRADRKRNKILEGQRKAGEAGQGEDVNVRGLGLYEMTSSSCALDAFKDFWDVAADLVACGVAAKWGWCRGE